MTAEDVAAAEEVAHHAFSHLREARHLPPEERTESGAERTRQKIRYLLSTDPGGSWVAADGDRVVGVGQALVRGDVWVLSLLVVLPSHQDRRAGRALLEQTLGHGDPTGPGMILASMDPRALHRYASAGFDLHPALVASGPARRPVAAAPGVRTVAGGPDTGAELVSALDDVDVIDGKIRGASRRPDMAFLLDDPGARLHLDPGRGYAVAVENRILTVAALDEQAATRVLEAAVSSCPADASVEYGWITGGQQWAIRTAVGAGIELRVHGAAVMVRGWPRPPDCYLPNGAFG